MHFTYTEYISSIFLLKVFERETFSNADSVEGIMYSLNRGVIMSGNFVESCQKVSLLLHLLGTSFYF